MTSHITTHVLDAVRGTPATGVAVTLAKVTDAAATTLASGITDDAATTLATGTTDDDGRIRELGPERLEPGTYRITFATGEYFAARGVETFYPQVSVDFRVEEGREHYHVPLLLSPFAFSTYRGS